MQNDLIKITNKDTLLHKCSEVNSMVLFWNVLELSTNFHMIEIHNQSQPGGDAIQWDC